LLDSTNRLAMFFPAYRINPQETESFFDLIKNIHTYLSAGGCVNRWYGPPSLFAEPGNLFLGPDAMGKVSARLRPANQDELSNKHLIPLKSGRAALLWDKSFLWGYMAVSSLRSLGFSFDVLTASAVREGALKEYQLLVVPGGWAGLKSEALGVRGLEQLRSYVNSGGAYLGICGGAGLALQVDEGLGLLPVARKSMNDRLPNFSGSITVLPSSPHPLWWSLTEEVSFQVWWPSQFNLLDPESVRVVGRYGKPGRDFCVADLKACDISASDLNWSLLEKSYEINLDPERLLNEPAVLEGKYGEGRILLSYPHLETPGDPAGNMALFNIWHDLLTTSVARDEGDPVKIPPLATIEVDEETVERVRTMTSQARTLVSLGEKYQLWSWRNRWFLQWKRGVRGAEFGTVFLLLKGLTEELERAESMAILSSTPHQASIREQVDKLGQLWRLFHSNGGALIEEEGNLFSAHKSTNNIELSSRARTLRTNIFSCTQCYGSKSYGGLYRELLDQIDSLLLGTLLARSN